MKKYFFLILVVLFISSIAYSVFSVDSKNIPSRSKPYDLEQSTTSNVSPELKKIRPAWWESGKLIYYKIPARVLFYLPPESNATPETINKAIWFEFDRISDIFNPFNPDSEISILNSSDQSDQIFTSKDIYSILQTSYQLWVESEGHFDPTIWSIKHLWKKAESTQQVPSNTEIQNALKFSGFNRIQFASDKDLIIKISGHPVMFDFGGIVKGYAVDNVTQILINNGVTAGLVQLGGEIRTFGNNNGNPWRIGIQHPKKMDKVWGIISHHGSLGVSTSGNYRQPIIINGQSFYHIFSPKTGRPVSEKVLGVTTVSLNGKVSNGNLDGIATAITVMGATKGILLSEQLNIESLILFENEDGSIRELKTPDFEKIYTRSE